MQKTSWGDANLVEAERRLMANALLDLSNERFALLSESCIPIFDFPTVYAHLTGANTSFVDCFDDRNGRFRYNPFFAGHNITLAQWRKGSQWFEMDRALALEVVSDEAYFPVFRGFCDEHRGCVIDEHYIPTLVNLLGWNRRNADRTLTYMEWRPGTSHPRNHGGKDVTEELFKKMRGGAANCSYSGGVSEICFVFARKFSPDALGALLDLAPKVMGFG